LCQLFNNIDTQVSLQCEAHQVYHPLEFALYSQYIRPFPIELWQKRFWHFCILDFDRSVFKMHRVREGPSRNILVFTWSKSDNFGGRTYPRPADGRTYQHVTAI